MIRYLFFAFILFRILIIFNVGFIDDEAYHWTWAKNLNYSYFDHPGMVAWMIWPFIKLFGDQSWAIRMPGFLMFLGICFVVFKLAKDLFGVKVAQISTLLLFLIPLWSFASLGTLPDVPLAFFWILIAWVFWQSVKLENPWSVKKTWLWIGLLMGLGMNSKLTVCLIGLGMGLFLLLTPRLRWHLLTPWPYLGALLTFILMAPVFYWNSQHEWASFHYQFLSRHQEAHGIDISRWLQFWSYQWIFMSPIIYVLMMLGLFYGLYKGLFRAKDDRWRFISLLPLPALILFYYQPLMSAYKPHWSGPAYMILLFGAVQLFLQMWTSSSIKGKSILIFAGVLSLLPFQLLYIPLFTPVIPKVFSWLQNGKENPTPWNPTWDFSNEFYGWVEVGEHIKKLRTEIETQTSHKVHFGAQRYELISQLTWGTNEKVWQLCRERDQFFYDQPLEEKMKLMGDDFLIVNNDKYSRDPMEIALFDRCEKSEFPFYRGDFLARTFFIYHCFNFQGLK